MTLTYDQENKVREAWNSLYFAKYNEEGWYKLLAEQGILTGAIYFHRNAFALANGWYVQSNEHSQTQQ